MKTVAFAGEVDFGKSTLVGKLLQETNAIPISRIKSVQSFCKDSGKDFEPAFLLDCFEEERAQEKTWDFSEFLASFKNETFRFIDTPGHAEFVHKMISGASHCDCAVLVCDASLEVTPENLRHLHVMKVLGTSRILVALTKLDAVGFSEVLFNRALERILFETKRLGMDVAMAVPVSGKTGENLLRRTNPELFWYDGPTLMEAIASFKNADDSTDAFKDLVISIQAKHSIGDRNAYYARVENGQLKENSPLYLHNPSESSIAIAWRPASWPEADFEAKNAGDIFAFHSDVSLERGTILTDSMIPPEQSSSLKVWLAPFEAGALRPGLKTKMRLGFQSVPATVRSWNGTVAEFDLDRPIFTWKKNRLNMRRVSLPEGVGILS